MKLAISRRMGLGIFFCSMNSRSSAISMSNFCSEILFVVITCEHNDMMHAPVMHAPVMS